MAPTRSSAPRAAALGVYYRLPARVSSGGGFHPGLIQGGLRVSVSGVTVKVWSTAIVRRGKEDYASENIVALVDGYVGE